MQYNVCLVIIFNHRYEKNLTRLRKMYSARFRKIVFLMPFYDGMDEDVIPVYESSYQFQGFLIQAYSRLADIDAEYFMFVGDDLIMNPKISEKNMTEYFNMYEKEVFCHNISKLTKYGFEWWHTRKAAEPFFSLATEWKNSLPSYNEAKEKYENFFSCDCPDEYSDDFFEKKFVHSTEEEHKRTVSEFIRQNGNSRKVPYPLAMGYSDIFIIKKSKLYEMSHIMGIFSAMNLFVEIAIPTTIVLTTERNKVSVLKDTGYKGILFWENNRAEFERKYDYSIDKLFDNWPEDQLYLHPVKLSSWSD